MTEYNTHCMFIFPGRSLNNVYLIFLLFLLVRLIFSVRVCVFVSPTVFDRFVLLVLGVFACQVLLQLFGAVEVRNALVSDGREIKFQFTVTYGQIRYSQVLR